jgi:nucleotide-binding universal stress UspA family protein
MPRIDHVICPVDFTPASRRALTYAAAWARWYDARLHVIHVAPLQMVSAPLAGVAVMLESRPLSEVRQTVAELAGRVDLTGIEVDIEVVEGDAPAQIRAAVDRRPRALVILGSHERTRLERFVLGSVAQRVVAGTPVPVLLVPPHDEATPPETVGCKHILCAVDLLPSSFEGLRYALSLAAEADATLEVLHVVDAPQGPQPTDHFRVPEYLQHRADAALQEVRAHIPAHAREACTVREAAAIGDPAAAILDAAERSHAGVIVLGAGDRAHLRSLWLAPTIGGVLRAARCPVLVVPLSPVVGRTLALGGRRVAAPDWPQFLDVISLSHLGHAATLTVIAPGAADCEVRTLPLLGLTAEPAASNDINDIVVMLGAPGAPHLTHVVRHPVEIRVEERHTHGLTRLLLRSDEGTETLVELTSPRGA